MATMRATALASALLIIVFAAPVSAQTRIDAINTNFRWLGPDDKIVVERYDDPKVPNVSCYMSRAETGGIKGGLGFAEARAGSRSRVALSDRSASRPDYGNPR